MSSLSYILAHGPQLFANIISWIGPALAFLAAIWTSVRLFTERSALVVSAVALDARGQMLVTVANIGGRFGVDIELSVGELGLIGTHGGVAAVASQSVV